MKVGGLAALGAALMVWESFGLVERDDPAKYFDLTKLSAVPTFRACSYPGSKVPGMRDILVDGFGPNDARAEFFCYYALPEAPMPQGGYPAVLLVHGGGGTAYPNYVDMWRKLGFAVLAPDLRNARPAADKVADCLKKEMPWPAETYPLAGGKRNDVLANVKNLYVANTLLRRMPEVNPDKTVYVGLSWGSWLGGILAAIDSRPNGYVMIYCADKRIDREAYIDGSFLHLAKKPMYWAAWSHDPNAWPEHHQLAFETCPTYDGCTIENAYGHGHLGFGYGAVQRMALHYAVGETPLPRLGKPVFRDGRLRAKILGRGKGVTRASVWYTFDGFGVNAWERRFVSAPADCVGDEVSALLPADAQIAYLSAYEADEGRYHDGCGSSGYWFAPRNVSRTQTTRAQLLGFAESRDRFSFPYDLATGAWKDGKFVVTPKGGEKFMVNFAHSPSTEPTPAPRFVIIRTKPAFKGKVTVRLACFEKHRTFSFSAQGDGKGDVRIPVDLPYGDEVNLHQNGFEGFATFEPVPEFRARPFALLSVDGCWSETMAQAARFALDVDGSRIWTITDPAQKVYALLTNAACRKLHWTGEFTSVDYHGAERRQAYDVTVAPHETAKIELKGPFDRMGTWTVTATVKGDDGSVARRTRTFARIRKNPVTAKLEKPKFRFGVNWHVEGEPGFYRDLQLETLNALGAKLVRIGGFAFGSTMAKGPDEWRTDWMDKTLEQCEAHGLAVNTMVWPVPQWAVAEDRQQKGYMVWSRSLPRPGLMRDYCEKLARRYGTRIDYYEVGNELDTIDAGKMTSDEYVIMQKEAYEGCKRGNPNACVTTCGFAGPSSDFGGCGQKGFQENALVKAKGHYDIHCVHLHDGFSAYTAGILGKCFPMRKELGVTVPWYPNETAFTGFFGGERVIPRQIWQKIVFSMANGAVDYIWYNLRATGWSKQDSEGEYGLVNPDCSPRHGFAAYAALAHLLCGGDYVKTYRQESPRYVYRFRKADKTVFVAWDDNAKTSVCFRVRTDAAKACEVDVVGNSRPVDVKDGVACFTINADPTAYVFAGATVAEPHEGEISEAAAFQENVRVIPRARPGRAPDVRLDRAEQVHSFFGALPEKIHRLWTGPEDLSAEAWLEMREDALALVFDVSDDRHVLAELGQGQYNGDDIQVVLKFEGQNGMWEIGLARTNDGASDVCIWYAPGGFDAKACARAIRLKTCREGTRTHYEAELPFADFGLDEQKLRRGFRFNFLVNENDGEGRDGWIEWVPGISGNKDPSKFPLMRFQ